MAQQEVDDALLLVGKALGIARHMPFLREEEQFVVPARRGERHDEACRVAEMDVFVGHPVDEEQAAPEVRYVGED
jgi:hypothetical protein